MQVNNALINTKHYLEPERRFLGEQLLPSKRGLYLLTLVEFKLSELCLFAWSFSSCDDSSFFTVMHWGKKTGMNSAPLCSPFKRLWFHQRSEEVHVTRERVLLNVCCNPESRVG